MADIPIIFSGPMVRALLDGRKTMTRRLATRFTTVNRDTRRPLRIEGPSPWQKVKPGDRLWVRENAWFPPPLTERLLRDGADTWPKVFHDADLDPGDREWNREHRWKQKPSIHMPRWASRITLLVEAVKVERLQDISETDAIAEGVYSGEDGDLGPLDISARALFADLWKSLHGPESAAANPEVVALTFRVVRENIDKRASRDTPSSPEGTEASQAKPPHTPVED